MTIKRSRHQIKKKRRELGVIRRKKARKVRKLKKLDRIKKLKRKRKNANI